MNKDLNEVECKLERDARHICRGKNQEDSSMKWKVTNFKVVSF